ncbi:uncharacterized protein ASCRUDRAFT_9310 [Ascoidea rubescens DSM 1968]|uniref:C2H2-type domain-containing protein n=1 Tax=Ascoidea rubescens DSM 1968 TaxID=1344418 RepID=A0A1D2VDD1_9ASCO|nr:hypothetical protein ASCRUDRAFT_9310 [Ascoidea rubescens DSM 1968]ODV59646.1 hypothetical protein ASCRUDRAFT_9310 [Ascoidea rubescens DSM 1968]
MFLNHTDPVTSSYRTYNNDSSSALKTRNNFENSLENNVTSNISPSSTYTSKCASSFASPSSSVGPVNNLAFNSVALNERPNTIYNSHFNSLDGNKFLDKFDNIVNFANAKFINDSPGNLVNFNNDLNFNNNFNSGNNVSASYCENLLRNNSVNYGCIDNLNCSNSFKSNRLGIINNTVSCRAPNSTSFTDNADSKTHSDSQANFIFHAYDQPQKPGFAKKLHKGNHGMTQPVSHSNSHQIIDDSSHSSCDLNNKSKKTGCSAKKPFFRKNKKYNFQPKHNNGVPISKLLYDNREIDLNAKKKGGYKCNSCSLIFTALEEFAHHLDYYNHQASHNYKCEKQSCIYSVFGFAEKDALVQHVKEHEPPGQQCGICGMTSHRRWRIKKHMLTHSKKTSLINASRISNGEPSLLGREEVLKISDMLN